MGFVLGEKAKAKVGCFVSVSVSLMNERNVKISSRYF